MMKRISVLLVALVSSIAVFAANPDFAYPKTTLDNALRHYDEAIASPSSPTSGIAMIKSLLEIAGATGAIDPDSVPSVVPMIDRAIAAFPDGADKALMLAVKAELISSIYIRDRWKYDANETPDEPLPADITEWNGRQFRQVITTLAGEAFDMASATPATGLADYSEVIEADRLALRVFPDVTSFVALKATDLMRSNDDEQQAETVAEKMTGLSRPQSDAWAYWAVRHISYSSSDTASTLKALYDRNRDAEASGYILNRCADFYSKDSAAEWALPALRDFIARYPDYWGINALKNKVAEFTRPEVTLSCKEIVAPQVKFDITLSYSYSRNAGYKIYSISAESFKNYNFVISAAKEVTSLTINADPSVAKADTVVTVTLPKPGYYAVIPSVNGESSRYSVRYLRCIPYLPALNIRGREAVMTVADYVTGAPVEDASVSEIIDKKPTLLGKTGKKGSITFTRGRNDKKSRFDVSYDITCRGFTENFFADRGWNYNSSYDHSQTDNIEIFTDRALYHPGDTIRWSAIVYHKGINAGTSADVQLNLYLRNPNSQKVDSASVTSDSYGRVYGSFVAPADGLTGNFTIIAHSDAYMGGKGVTVSDFKLPTFKIEKADVSRDEPSAGDVTVASKAVTYAGMPVAGAKVEAEIFEAYRWRWFTPQRSIGTLSAVTDSDGSFSIVAADSLLTASESKNYVAKITVTSTSGEACHTSVPFTTGKPYIIVLAARSPIDSSEKIDKPFEAYDASGNEVSIPVRWWLSAGGSDRSKAVASGECTTGAESSVSFGDIPARDWTLTVEPVDTTLAGTESYNVTTYSLRQNRVPAGSVIFIPDYDINADVSGEFEVLFGVSENGTYVYSSLATGSKFLAQDVRRYEAGFHRLKMKLPEDQTCASLALFTFRDGKHTEKQLRISAAQPAPLAIEGSSMRDRLTSGETERWTLKLSDKDGNTYSGAMIATMFNSALNSLSSYRMPSALNNIMVAPNQYLKFAASSWNNNIGYSCNIRLLKVRKLTLPEFNPEIRQTVAMLRYAKVYGAAKVADMAEESVEDSGNAVFIGAISANGAEGRAIKIRGTGAADENYVTAGEQSDEPEFEYRPSEVLQAFWMPDILIDDKGEALLTFTVPDANTTWSFNAFAWTSDLRSAKMMREFIASKPVMVQPNLPRFLRTGDTARVLATVYNNSGSTAAVNSVIEIFDINSGKIISTFTSTDTIAASASAIAAATVTAPADAAAIGYRVRSTLGRFTDGEQSAIPVIASTSDVIESETFYLNPGDADYSMTLPKGKDMQSTLDYTDNPAWNIIRQLPGLADRQASTSTAASHMLFGAATAAGMLKSYPALAEVIRQWSEDPDSKALIARLGQNEELKTAVLSSTPWVQAAAGDNGRMARLSLLLDKKTSDRNIASSVEMLHKLQRADGGWVWGDWCSKSSLWATNIVLQDLGRLNAAGYLPEGKGLDEMIGNAISYYESNLGEDTKTDYALAFITTLFPDHKLGLRGTQVVNATLRSMMSSWKSASAWGKAMNALILYSHGYKNVAAEILNSLSQFGVRSADKGTSFPSVNNVNDYADILYAFARIRPGSSEIDGIRQWLVVRTQVTDDLGSCDPTRLIAAFAACGSRWLTDSNDMATIKAGESVIPADQAEKATGHIVIALPQDVAGKRLSIVRHNSQVPAYGAVISRFAAKSATVKASSCPDLSIEKRITVLRDGKWQYADEIRLGEQVKIVLTIKARRDLEYVTVIDERPASFEPVEQLPGRVWSGGAGFYRENRNTDTRLFIDYLRKGTYQITIEMTASVAGEFTSGIATVQSQLAPAITAHSAGSTLICK